MTLLVGTSGWQYRDWRTAFYPTRLAQTRWLEHYAARFRTVEVNNAFYRLPTAETFTAWAARTPADFVVALKASRYLTHIRRLREPEAPVALLMERARHLGAKLGPVLVQLPPTMQVDAIRLERTLAAFPVDVRVAVEPRHPSWWTAEVRAVLERRGAALCLADRLGEPVTPLWRTADFTFLRLHQGRTEPDPGYADAVLRDWAHRLRDLVGVRADAFVFFNNDPHCCAVADAVRFAGIAAGVGLRPTRTPDPDEVTPWAGG